MKIHFERVTGAHLDTIFISLAELKSSYKKEI